VQTYDFNAGETDLGPNAPISTLATELTEFSYSFHNNMRWKDSTASYGITLSNTQDPGKPMVADRNPYSNNVGARVSSIASGSPFTGLSPGLYRAYYDYDAAKVSMGFGPPLKSGDPKKSGGTISTVTDYSIELRNQASANSRNHNREGQNVGYLDGHAKWAKTPKCGVDEDSIWSPWMYKAGVPGEFDANSQACRTMRSP